MIIRDFPTRSYPGFFRTGNLSSHRGFEPGTFSRDFHLKQYDGYVIRNLSFWSEFLINHGAKTGEIQEKGVMCVKGRHGGVVKKVRIQGLATPGPGGYDGRGTRTMRPKKKNEEHWGGWEVL